MRTGNVTALASQPQLAPKSGRRRGSTSWPAERRISAWVSATPATSWTRAIRATPLERMRASSGLTPIRSQALPGQLPANAAHPVPSSVREQDDAVAHREPQAVVVGDRLAARKWRWVVTSIARTGDGLPEAGRGDLLRGAGEGQEPEATLRAGRDVDAVVLNAEHAEPLALAELDLRSIRDAHHVDIAVERIRVARAVRRDPRPRHRQPFRVPGVIRRPPPPHIASVWAWGRRSRAWARRGRRDSAAWIRDEIPTRKSDEAAGARTAGVHGKAAREDNRRAGRSRRRVGQRG